MNPAREEILAQVRSALKRGLASEVSPIPLTARFPSRVPGDTTAELNQLFAEIEALGGATKQCAKVDELATVLRELVKSEDVKKAVLWQTSDLREWGVEAVLRSIGVEIVAPYASYRELAECDLGITGVDYVLPETGTLVLRSSVEQPRAVSLLPRVHLAILRPIALRADLHQVFDEVQGTGYFVFVTGPSRTADIELTLTIGVHGPKRLYVFCLYDS
jgi:L-lactate dehydrogenase complex protein LldG